MVKIKYQVLRTRAYILYITTAIATLVSGCSSESVIEPEKENISGSTDLMRFTITQEQQSKAATSRASTPLETGFMVSCYKHYDTANQQTVMPQYEVRHHTSGTSWDGNVRSYWTYDDVSGQYPHYWDYSAFPYRFNALAPYPQNTAGYELLDKKLVIPTAYYAQTCTNGLNTPTDRVAEPHLVAQVQRNTDGTDYDLMGEPSIINNASTTKSRDVWMPFHHINSKIRFGIYHATAWLTANKVYIKDLVINITSPQFATQAAGYAATGNATWRIDTGNSGFTDLSYVNPTTLMPYQIFRFDGGVEVEDNDLTERQTKQTAYFLHCPNGIMQIPQEKVQMTVSFDLYTADHSFYKSFRDVPVRTELENEPGVYQYSFDWRSGFIHTYYLVLGKLDDSLEITFTATLMPWEDITASLSTDLEK